LWAYAGFCVRAAANPTEALAAIDEAIQIYQLLAGALPQVFTEDLSSAYGVRKDVLETFGDI
jgi:hypothetical protein